MPATSQPTQSSAQPAAAQVPAGSERPTASLPDLPPLNVQAERLISLGVPELAGIDAARVRKVVDGVTHPPSQAPLLVLPGAPVGALAPLMTRAGKPGFVVQDMTDVDEFTPIEGLDIPQQPYVLEGVDRGDELRNASPEEAMTALTEAGRTPLTLTEGIFWVLAQPEALAANHCFMTIASRRRKARGGLDARTPALWISGGTGRDGAERRGAAKVGWCWARNRHTWLGFASALERTPIAK